jgi:hypothetical protein
MTTTRTLTVKLMQGEASEMPVTLFFQAGDWAVTQGICKVHVARCYRLTHIPSTCCIPVCIHSRPQAIEMAREINASFPKFKEQPTGDVWSTCVKVCLEVLRKRGIKLVPNL